MSERFSSEDKSKEYLAPPNQLCTELSSSLLIGRAHTLLPSFSKLRENADLNCPPSNWLRSGNVTSFPYRLNRSPKQNVSCTSTATEETGQFEPLSVTLASHYPMAVGHVDVVADAKVIKKLLKLSYSDSLVSLAIHRAGTKTLLIDDFNASLLLNTVARSNLERLFQDNPALNPSRYVYPRKKDPENTHHRNMLSKLLYYSVQEDSCKALAQASRKELVQVPSASATSTSQLLISNHVTSSQDHDMNVGTTETACNDSIGGNDEMLETSNHDNESLELVKAKHPSILDDAQRVFLVGKDLPSCQVAASQKIRFEIPSTQQLPEAVSLVNDNASSVVTSLPIQKPNIRDSPNAAPNAANEMGSFPNQLPHLSPQPFYQNMQWSVKDTSMLLGSDLPIFGVDGHPAISLRLRDKMKPITVLTGMEYWLDNLMCNVPELAMCFHVDGILQNYHIVKTEDIPKLDEGCLFSPEEVLEVIHSILEFLKANCTREGHTYWLFRKKGEDVVKLYDLTSLNCFKGDGDEDHNPFAKSVAVLFYRVAHNMLRGEELCCEELAVAKVLLENCIKLLAHWDKEICLSAYCLLADLFLKKAPLHSDPTPPERRESCNIGAPSDESASEESSSQVMQSVISQVFSPPALQSVSVSLLREGGCGLSVDKELPLLPPLVVDSSLDRARLALEQVSKALLSLDINGPLFPEKLPPWELLGTSKVLAQAGSAYLLLTEISLDQNKLGRALRYGKYSILCSYSSFEFQVRVEPATQKKLHTSCDTLCQAWQLCGDIHCLSTKLSDSFSANLEDFHSVNQEDLAVIQLAQYVVDFSGGLDEKDVLCLSLHTELESSLLRSVDCYKQAVSLAPKFFTNKLEERLGNAWNELGVYYLQVAASSDFSKEVKLVEKLWKSSYSCICNGLVQFKKTGNVVNQSLLCANLGKLMCSCAQAHNLEVGLSNRKGKDERVEEFKQQEKLYYLKSIEYYFEAKQTLRRRSVHPEMWINVIVDLSSVCLSMGTIMLRNPPLSYLTEQEVSQEVSDVLNKALFSMEPELANLNTDHPRYIELCRLTGDCHARLSDLHHQNSLSSSLSLLKLKQIRTLTEKHYNQALAAYKVDHHFSELIEMRLNYSHYSDYHAQGKGRLKGLQSSLYCLVGAIEPLKALASWLDKPALPGSRIHSLCHSLMHRLVEVLKQLLVTSRKRSDTAILLPFYKQMYGEILLKFQQIQPKNKLSSNDVCIILESCLSLKKPD